MSAVPFLAIELRGVRVCRAGRVLLDGVDLAVEEGQSCGIVGANGSGKSALLRVVAGLCRPSRGDVRINGLDLFKRPSEARRLVGYAGDEDGLAERMSAEEHLDMVAAQRGLARADREVAVDSMLELVDLIPRRDARVEALSRGQRRRLALALALVHDPPIILLDEPLSGVDETGRGELASVLLELHAMGKTILIASPSVAEVAEVCDVVIPLARGRLETPDLQESTILTWIEPIGEIEAVLRTIREHPGVDAVHEDGGVVTFRGPTTGEERAQVVDWLTRNGVRLAGFGAVAAPVHRDGR